jgi:hypothetical protein
MSAPLVCNSFDKVDDATPELRPLDTHERFKERVPVARDEEVGHIGWRRSGAFRPRCAL